MMDLDTLKGLLWGAALGDALGAPHEFKTGTPLRHYTGRLEFPLVRQNQWQGRRVGVVGQITDDSEMTFTLADTIAADRRYDPDRAVVNYMTWANSGCPFMGKTTRDLLHGVKTLQGYRSRFQATYGMMPQDVWSQSNGCLMRCSPLAVLGEAGIAAAKLDAALTNPHPVCVDSCQAYIRALVALSEGETPAAVRAAAPEWAETAEVRGVLADAADNAAADRGVTGQAKGWVLHALWAASRSLKVLEETGTYEEAIDWVVRLGGDTDTNACIAGALLGASRGYEALTAEARTGPNIATALAANPALGAIDRPPEYHAARIDGLAARLLGAD